MCWLQFVCAAGLVRKKRGVQVESGLANAICECVLFTHCLFYSLNHMFQQVQGFCLVQDALMNLLSRDEVSPRSNLSLSFAGTALDPLAEIQSLKGLKPGAVLRLVEGNHHCFFNSSLGLLKTTILNVRILNRFKYVEANTFSHCQHCKNQMYFFIYA